jgi:hypothetical protein
VSVVWTDAETAELRRLFAEGVKLDAMAGSLGYTKCAVIGKIDRLAKAGTLGSPRRVPIARPVKRAPELLYEIEKLTACGIGKRPIAKALGISKDLVQKIRVEIRVAPKPVMVAPSPSPPAPIPRREGGPQCEWLSGNKPFVRCEAERETGSSYCAHHHRRVYVRRSEVAA